MQIDVLFAFLTSVFFLTLSPGPDIIYVFYKSSTSGFKEAAKLSIGLTSGLLIHTLLVVLGISALIKSNQDYFNIIKYFGFIYFTYLALNQFFKKNLGRFFVLIYCAANFSRNYTIFSIPSVDPNQ